MGRPGKKNEGGLENLRRKCGEPKRKWEKEIFVRVTNGIRLGMEKGPSGGRRKSNQMCDSIG